MTAPRIVPNDKIIAAMSPEDRKAFGLKTREEITAKQDDKAEKCIQAEVEAWLRIHGYWPRTPAFLDGKKPERGWYIHYNKKRTAGNPIILDLIILSNTGKYLELELKTRTGSVRDAQSVLIKNGAAMARSTTEAIDIVKKWEGE